MPPWAASVVFVGLALPEFSWVVASTSLASSIGVELLALPATSLVALVRILAAAFAQMVALSLCCLLLAVVQSVLVTLVRMVVASLGFVVWCGLMRIVCQRCWGGLSC